MSSIRITKWFGRLGNNAVQLAHAVHLAQELGIRQVEHPPHSMFRGRVIDTGADGGSHPGLAGEFFHARSLLPLAPALSMGRRKQIFLGTLWPRLVGRDCLGPEEKSLLQRESTLVIHVRSGDVFSANPHRGYVQPPLWYYRTILEGGPWKDVLLVSEDDRNPVIAKLCADYPDIRLHRASLARDFSVLCHAANLVGSYGTFTHAAFCFNADIRRYWIPGFLRDGPDFASAFPERVTLLDCPGYIRVGEWGNSPEQRQTMLDYHPGMEPLLVISPGGMACSFIVQSMRRMGFSTNCPRDTDGLKHCPAPGHPGFTQYREARKLYIWNHPLSAILSLHRRGWLVSQQRKLRRDGGPFPQHLEDLWRQTIAAGRDITGIARHFEQWFTDQTPGIFWLDFRQIDQQRPALAAFLGRPVEQLQSLLLRPRHSTVPPGIPADIVALYEALDRQVGRRMLERLRQTDGTAANLSRQGHPGDNNPVPHSDAG